ncbi:hypothetical protein CCR95_08525 [Thiocystis minor]|uniref:flagellar filament capping protein FliD n=1 Tax=Thiocystis minor TaxID=61597 RepID=UPI001913AA3B|nr:flagellar filament capping protein FliD [Thiocystis minor]MBK5964128.1 hypothetical protein [Thiocystis minor]
MTTVTTTGLGSGLDINNIVTKLMEAERTPQTVLFDKQEATDQARISAFGSFKSGLSAFQTAVGSLRHSTSFSQMQATSSEAEAVSASASLNAEAGDYTLNVKQLAQAQNLASKTYANTTDVVGSGTLTIKFGTNNLDPVTGDPTDFTQNPDEGTLTLTLDATNNSLLGVRDAINKAGAAVKASIVNDGGGNRLVLTSTSTGARNGMEITVADSDGNNTDASGLSALAFNQTAPQMSQTLAAQDAVVGINGLDVTSTTNAVSTALKGVTLNLHKAQPGESVNLSIAANTSGITEGVQGFVDKFNELVTTVNSIASYDPETRKAGVLLGDFTVQGAMRQIRSFLTRSVDGLDGSIKSLMNIGISTKADGTLALDTEKLSAAIKTNKNDVVALFAPLGVASDNGVTYVSKTADTKAGNHALAVTTAATRGSLAGAAGPSRLVDASNSALLLTVDGVASGSIAITQGNYATGAELAAELQSRINGDANLKAGGASVTVQYNGTTFSIESRRYGSESEVEINQIGAAESGALLGGLAVGAGTAGKDVVATLNGKETEGVGRQITGLTGDAKGLRLELNDDVIGDRGSVRYTSGLVAQLDEVFAGLLGAQGTLESRLGSLQDSVATIEQERTDLTTRMEKYELQLFKQFNAMDKLVSQFQSTSTYLTQQLANLPYANTRTFTG